MQRQFGIHWFRRDLRVAGNQALQYNWKVNEGRVVGVFCFDSAFLRREDFSVNRFHFFLKTLEQLQIELRGLGSDLLFLDLGPQEMFPKLLKSLKADTGTLPSLISWGQDYEPFSRQRDQWAKSFFNEQGVPTHVERDHLLIEPHELTKRGTEGEHYQVYTPFSKRWLELYQDEEVVKRIKRQQSGLKYLEKSKTDGVEKIFQLCWKDLLSDSFFFQGNLERYISENLKRVTVEIPKAGALTAYEELKKFSKKIDRYKDLRDFPNEDATSRLSLFLKNGSLTISQIIAHLKLKPYRKKTASRDSYFSELIWREFYYHILFHNPRVEQEAFLQKYRDISWENRGDWFECWKEGKTGFPIVDAGMRQLKNTGWMHNRVRMIVASFLTKDLLIDWRWGERYFMKELLDGDLAPNNGGWQWAASTGCDPQPYFRIFNPWSQSQKFDPEGHYIRTHLPELANVPVKELHAPIIGHASYPSPIVDHSVQREKALALYKK